MSVHTKLAVVQATLNAPKNQRNNFGNYNYRSAEDILEAVKPLTHDQGLTLVVSDIVVAVEDRIYVVAVAKVTDVESGETVEAHGWAREPQTKKGMDESQITGAASSYARKYAMNGLFAIDDAKDADTDEHTKQVKSPAAKPAAKPKPVDDGNPPWTDQAAIDTARERLVAVLKAKKAPGDHVKMKCLEYGKAGLSEVDTLEILADIQAWAEREGWAE